MDLSISRAPLIRVSNFSKNKKVLNLLKKFEAANAPTEYLCVLNEVLQVPELSEALLVSSKSLYSAIRNVNKLNEKHLASLFSSTYEYLKRATSRATPFGLLSSICLGNYSMHKNFTISRHIRLSPKFLLSIYNDIISNVYFFPKQKVSLSPTSTVLGNFLINYIQGENAVFKEGDTIRYEFDIYIKTIYRMLNNKETTIIELISALMKNSHKSLESIISILIQLLRERLIIGELYPVTGIDNIDFIDYIKKIERLSNSNFGKLNDLRSISVLIKKYEQLGGILNYKRLINLTEKMFNMENTVIVDSETNNLYNIPEIPSKDLEDLANFLNRISLYYPSTNSMLFNIFENRFIEKYGYNNRVPILKVFDENISLGSPYYYVNYNSLMVKKQKELNESIRNWEYSENVKHDFLDLSTLVISTNDNQPFPDYIRPSLDLNFHLFFSDNKILLSLGKTPSSFFAKGFNGRFSYFTMERDIKDSTQAALQYLPSNEKLQNIYYNNSNFKKHVVVNGFINPNNSDSKIQVPLNKISMSVNNNNKFEFTDENKNYLLFDQGCIANPGYESDLTRFLVWISSYSTNIPDFLDKIDNLGNNYRQRIMFRNLIVCPSCWRIPKRYILENKLDDIKNYIKLAHIPRYVNYVHLDQLLPLDLTVANDIKLLIKFAKKENQFIKLEERYDFKFHQALEATFSFKSALSEKKYKLKCDKHCIKENEKYRYPKHWIYAKIYLPKGEENNFIINNISEFINKNDNIKQWFFIRYFDPKPHIRLRIHTSDKKVLLNVIDWLEDLRESAIIANYIITPYHRELERYGGAKIYPDIEQIFMLDSLCVIKILCYIKDNSLDKLESSNLILKNLEYILENVHIKNKIILKTLQTNELTDKKLKNDFRQLNISKFQIPSDICTLSQEIYNVINKIVDNNILNGTKKSNCTINEWISSLIHMHFNRLNGDLSFENAMRAQEFRILRSYFWNKRLENNHE